MLEQQTAPRAAMAGWCTAAALALAGCGGGDAPQPPAGSADSSANAGVQDTSSAATTTATAPAVATPTGTQAAAAWVPPNYATVNAYLALRTPHAAEAPTWQASSRAARLQAAAELAAEQLWAKGGPSGTDALSTVPPLALSQLGLLRAASAGTTREQVDSLLAEVAAAQGWSGTAQVARQVTGAAGRQIAWPVLQGTDVGVAPGVAQWAGEERAATDDRWRMTVDDTVSASLPWKATLFDGHWGVGTTVYAMPMLRVQSGVTRYVGSDYRADAFAANGLTLLLVQPTSAASLQAFGAARLAAAVAESLPQVHAADAMPGEIVLPASLKAVSVSTGDWLKQRGVVLPYDEINADMHAFDSIGGVYASTAWLSSQIDWNVSGMALSAASSTAFLWSPKNVWTSASSVSSYFTSPWWGGSVTCPAADQHPFFALLLSETAADLQVLWAAAVQRPPSTDSCSVRTGFVITGP